MRRSALRFYLVFATGPLDVSSIPNQSISAGLLVATGP